MMCSLKNDIKNHGIQLDVFNNVFSASGYMKLSSLSLSLSSPITKAAVFHPHRIFSTICFKCFAFPVS